MSTEPAGGDGWPGGVDRLILDEVDSTMAEAQRQAGTLTRPTWIMARRQTRGRGRRGRPWQDPAGNFAATLLMFPEEPMQEVALNSFVAAIALRWALKAVAPSDGYALKWPNDVLLNGTKIAGILLESSGQGSRADWLSIGSGVNLQGTPPPEALEQRAIAPSSIRAELGIDVDPEELLHLLAIDFHVHRKLLAESGFDAIRRIWLRYAARRGETVTARTARDEITGIFEDVDGQGNLVLGTADGRVKIAAADVYF